MCHQVGVPKREAAKARGGEESAPSPQIHGPLRQTPRKQNCQTMGSSSTFSVVSPQKPQEASLSSSSGPGPGKTTADRWTEVGTCHYPSSAHMALQVLSPGSPPQTDCWTPPFNLSPSLEMECRGGQSQSGLGSYLDSDTYWQL